MINGCLLVLSGFYLIGRMWCRGVLSPLSAAPPASPLASGCAADLFKVGSRPERELLRNALTMGSDGFAHRPRHADVIDDKLASDTLSVQQIN